MKVSDDMLINNPEYLDVLAQVKAEIAQARLRANAAVCREGSLHYWRVGQMLNARSEWGNQFIDNLSRDIRIAYPDTTGYSRRNLMYMAQFARSYPTLEIVQRAVAQLPWGHNIVLMTKISDPEERDWYAGQAIENGWSRTVFALQIDTHLYQRQITASKSTNFGERLPPPQSDLAIQAIKEPYIFDIVLPAGQTRERDIEDAMVSNITQLLLELGTGFAFVGQQYHLEVEGDDFYVDLLFYHLKLRCYVVVELKTGKFLPEYAGQLNFYVSAVDELVKSDVDNPTIGILLCRDKRGLVAEFALKDIEKPIGVSEFKLTSELPEKYANLLPSAEDIQARIGFDLGGEEG